MNRHANVTNDSERRPRRLLLIHNPVAGARRRRRLAATLDALAAWGCTIALRETSRRGDGTINEVVNGMGATATPLGIIPLGTANVLAAEIGLPLRPGAIATVLASAHPRAIYPGVVNGRRFLMMAGIGFDARASCSACSRASSVRSAMAHMCCAPPLHWARRCPTTRSK